MSTVSTTRPESSNPAAETTAALAWEGISRDQALRPTGDPAWGELAQLGTQLWLDTGDLDAASALWSAEFSSLTTNNTLVNAEVQKGLFDELIPRAGRALRDAVPGLTEDQLVIETGFVLNCRVALRLVERFDVNVSVELHPAMSADVEQSLEYARRYHAVCPDRFTIKVPMSPAGHLIVKTLSAEGIPVNYTLGFSARQNVIAAAFAAPTYVNVFMGRLGVFVKDRGLGRAEGVGERATMATQLALLDGRRDRDWTTRLIGASMRSGSQLVDLAGLDVYTIPPAAAKEYLAWSRARGAGAPPLESGLGRTFEIEAEPESVLDCLWDVDATVLRTADALEAVDSSRWGPDELVGFLKDSGLPTLFGNWSDEASTLIRQDGKIPSWDRWRGELLDGEVALDDLFTQAALQSFVADQGKLDGRIRSLLKDAGLS